MQTKTLILYLLTAASASASTLPILARAKSAANATAAAATGAADFGSCNPAIDFQLGRPGRKATEGTFLPVDATLTGGQSDALNPNIITKFVCDQLTNVCDANAAAKTLCTSAQATVAALGTKDATTADAFNSALGVTA